MVGRGTARFITRDETLEFLERAESRGLGRSSRRIRRTAVHLLLLRVLLRRPDHGQEAPAPRVVLRRELPRRRRC